MGTALMPGEILAVLSALFYGLASVAIVRGHNAKDRDNGVFLSVFLTAAISGLIWAFFGHAGAEKLRTPEGGWALLIFALAGVFSIVLGRVYLYRATELLGAVRASLLRRLTPIFAIPFAFAILGTVPDWRDAIGGGIVMAGVLLFFRPTRQLSAAIPRGYVLAIGSAAFYALAYCLRSLGLADIPDPALGTFIGAMAGMCWLLAKACFQCGLRKSLVQYLGQRGRWQWMAALSLSIGQTLQFFALSTASVPVVAVLGTLEVIFAAALTAILGLSGPQPMARLVVCVGFALVGTALLVG